MRHLVRTIALPVSLALLTAGVSLAQPRPAVAAAQGQFFIREDLASPVVVPSNTTVAVIAQELTMPAHGGPWRIVGFYDVQVDPVGGGNCNCEVWLDDQHANLNVFADTAVGFPTNIGKAGFPGSGISRNSYLSGETVVVLLQVRAGDGFGVTVLPSAFGTAKTHLDLLIVPAR